MLSGEDIAIRAQEPWSKSNWRNANSTRHQGNQNTLVQHCSIMCVCGLHTTNKHGPDTCQEPHIRRATSNYFPFRSFQNWSNIKQHKRWFGHEFLSDRWSSALGFSQPKNERVVVRSTWPFKTLQSKSTYSFCMFLHRIESLPDCTWTT